MTVEQAPSGDALATLRHVFGHDAFRGAQAEIIAHVQGGGDALVLMPTGGGKSLCYQLPALLREGTAVVVSPLIALMQDQVDAARQLGIAAAALNSSLDDAERGRVESDFAAGRLKLLYVSPERLLGERTLQMLATRRIALFAIDEAHCVSQWGHDFRPEYQQLGVLHARFPSVPRIALTATADAQTRVEIVEQLALHEARVFVSSFDRPNIHLAAVEKDRATAQLLHFVEAHRGQCGIVYCLSRKRVEEVAHALVARGIEALPYHAGMTPDKRAEHQRRFTESSTLVMVATVAFGMGIDKPDVRFVAHLDLPKSLEGYYQEIGRAGRDGGPADAWLAYGAGDVVQLRRFIDQSEAPDERKRFEMAQLDALLAYAETTQCRRIALLRHFGETYPHPCGHCDNCLAPRGQWDATEPARMLLSAIYRTGQRFGAKHVIDVLRGSESQKIDDYGHRELAVHGRGAGVEVKTWRAILRQLLTRGYVRVDHERYNALRLLPAAGPLLKGEETLLLTRETEKVKRGRAKSTDRVAVDADAPLDDAAERRMQRLRAWRLATARAQKIAPFVIFHDRTLRAIALAAPASAAALREIPGVGDAKIARYGESLLALIDED